MDAGKGEKMKFKHYFIDHQGNIWRASTLIEASKNLKSEPFDCTSISLDELIRWKVSTFRDYVDHYRRVKEADCTVPIILRSDGYPMDGWHRIIRAQVEGLSLTARRFIEDPEPDFRNNV